MADPRINPKHEQIAPVFDTYKYDNVTITYSAAQPGGSASINLAIKISAANTVALADTDDSILGKLLRVEADGTCLVQVGGVMTLPQGNAVTTTPGKKIVGAQGPAAAKGYIKEVVSPGAAYVQAEAVANHKARGQILDNTDTTNVAVLMP